MIRRLPAAGVLVMAAACGTDGVVDPPDGPTPPRDTVAAAVVVAPPGLAFGALGSRDTLRATVLNAGGDTVAANVTWWSTGAGVVRVDETGRVTALTAGVDTVTAVSGTASANAVVTVVQVPTGLALGTTDTTLTVLGDTVALSAMVTDSNGFGVPGAATVTWTTSDPDVALVVADGHVIAAGAPGSAVITATAGDLSVSASVTVSLAGPDGPAILGEPTPCDGGLAGPFPCDGFDLVAYLPHGGFGAAPEVDVSDLWGWTDPTTGEEWVLLGHSHGTAFVNVTDPTRPTWAGTLPLTAGASPSAWRDIKVYADHAYMVSDGAGPHGMQVFDLRSLRDHAGPPEVFAPTAVYDAVASVHNLAINEASGIAYATGSNSGGETCGGGLHMIDLSTPAAPTFAGCFADPLTGRAGTGYTHDAQCVTYAGPDAAYAGREICFGLNETGLSIADVTDTASPVALSRASYPSVGYVHQGWLTPDHRYLYSNDESDEFQSTVTGSRTIIWDVRDLHDPLAVGEVIGPTMATDHNLYVRGDRLYASNYHYGIRVLDLADPTAPAELASFDTAPGLTDAPGFGGSWSNYPFFASGVIAVSSRDEGLFLLRIP